MIGWPKPWYDKVHVMYPTSALLLLCCAAMACRVPIESRPQPPNVLLILTDDQGWGDLSIHGNPNLQTPHVDAIAHQGASFERFYVSPVCSPTRAEILTGRYHPRCGVSGTSLGQERLDLDETTIAEVFKAAGYHTAAFGKWHNGMQYPYHPNGRGFDEFYGFCSGHWGDYFSPMLEHNGKITVGEGYVIDDFTSKAIDFIKDHRDAPFFVYLPYNTPHRPMQVPDRWWNKFKDLPLDSLHRDPNKEDLLHTRAALAMCENIDWNVGRIVDNIANLGLEENTIIIYASDNGPNGWRWNGGMKGRKGSTDEGGVRSPLLIQWKGTIKANHKIPEVTAAIDLFPTLVDLAGINDRGRSRLDGVSLKPLLLTALRDQAIWPERQIFSYWKGRMSVRDQTHLLDHEGKLFDLLKDPRQDIDLSAALPDRKHQLLQAKKSWQDEVLVELPKEDTRPFPLGHPDVEFTQIPARDGISHGGIRRSNPSPNCSFFTDWSSLADSITWNVEVLAPGEFEVVLYYTCPEEDVGGTFQLRCGSSAMNGKIIQYYDPPLRGMEHDRHPRGNSYVKDWQQLVLGDIQLEPGQQCLSICPVDIPGNNLMDFRLLIFRRI